MENDLEKIQPKASTSVDNMGDTSKQQNERNRSIYKDMFLSNLTKYNNFDTDDNSIEDLEFILQRIDKYYDLFAKFHFLLLQTPHLDDKEQLEKEHESMTDDFHTFSVRIESRHSI